MKRKDKDKRTRVLWRGGQRTTREDGLYGHQSSTSADDDDGSIRASWNRQRRHWPYIALLLMALTNCLLVDAGESNFQFSPYHFLDELVFLIAIIALLFGLCVCVSVSVIDRSAIFSS